jgi:sirohydrochlorin ferrochelatase
MRTSFVLVIELTPRHLDWGAARAQAEGLAVSLAPRLGLAPRVRLASLPPDHLNRAYLQDSSAGDDLASVLADEAAAGYDEIFVVPTMLDFGLVQRARLSEAVGGVRLDYHRTLVAYDDVPFDRRPLLQAFSERIYREAGAKRSPERSGLLLLASGEGDTSGRAQSYQLMRLVFEQLGFARGEVAFLDHARPLLEDQLERCARDGLEWAIVPQMMWRSEPHDDARQRLDAFRQSHPAAHAWTLLNPVGISSTPVEGDPVAFNLAAWIE